MSGVRSFQAETAAAGRAAFEQAQARAAERQAMTLAKETGAVDPDTVNTIKESSPNDAPARIEALEQERGAYIAKQQIINRGADEDARAISDLVDKGQISVAQGSDVLFGGTGSDEVRSDTGEDDSGGNDFSVPGPGLVDFGTQSFLDTYSDLDDAAFREKALEFGFVPENVALLRDLLNATPEEYDSLRERIFNEYRGPEKNALHGVLDKFSFTDNAEIRRHLLEPFLQYGRVSRYADSINAFRKDGDSQAFQDTLDDFTRRFEAAGDNPSQELLLDTAYLFASLAPVSGEILSAKEAYDAARAAVAAYQNGDIKEALLKTGEAVIGALGAIPIFGEAVRLTRAGLKGAKALYRLFEGGKAVAKAGDVAKVGDDAVRAGGRVVGKTKAPSSISARKEPSSSIRGDSEIDKISEIERGAEREGTVKVYRAVSEAEFEQIQKTGKFEQGPNSLGGKFFTADLDKARKWGDRLNGPENSRIVEVELPANATDGFKKFENLDGIGDAVYGELNQLEDVKIREFKE